MEIVTNIYLGLESDVEQFTVSFNFSGNVTEYLNIIDIPIQNRFDENIYPFLDTVYLQMNSWTQRKVPILLYSCNKYSACGIFMMYYMMTKHKLSFVCARKFIIKKIPRYKSNLSFERQLMLLCPRRKTF